MPELQEIFSKFDFEKIMEKLKDNDNATKVLVFFMLSYVGVKFFGSNNNKNSTCC